ncbi:tRNA lysidine(34) synthetase TilS [Rhodobacteraceae bacterium WD3A24]|nr:tRNA lysidine(34) synthetase TilS [Rhodobacteraceae bacterium WD3A24]
MLAAALDAALPEPPAALGLALSGGGDSTALAALTAEWAAARGVALHALTVDHGLRPEAAEEAAAAARLCADLDISHEQRRWRGWDERGNLQDAARRARRALITDWADARGLGAVALGHTRDDQAETVLIRLARGSGVDGLSGMAASETVAGLAWLRPLLGVSRAALRQELVRRGLSWCEDPSNADPRFDRVKARAALAALAPLGIDAAGLAETAGRMRTARMALMHGAAEAARRLIRVQAGDVLIDRAGLFDLPDEPRERLMADALRWVASAEYRPRHRALRRLLAGLAAGRGGTLHGCRVLVERDALRVTREWNAVRGTFAPPGALWDERWRVSHRGGPAPGAAGLVVGALGDRGLAQCPDWRESGLPAASLRASPAVWRGEVLVAAPLARAGGGWCAELAQGKDTLISSLIAH